MTENIATGVKKAVKEANKYTDNAIKRYSESEVSIAMHIERVKNDLMKRMKELEETSNTREESHINYRETNESAHKDIEMRL